MKLNSYNQNISNNPSFGANILVTEAPNFKKLPLKLLKESKQYIGAPWTVKDAVKFLDEGFTDGAIVCTSMFLKNQQNGCLLHLQPQNINNTNEAVAKTLIGAISKLREAGQEVTAFLTGGCSFYFPSEDFYGLIKDVLKQEKVPFSAVWGAKSSPLTDLFASIPRQELIVNHNLNNKVVKSRQDIEKLYTDVFVHKGDEFIFNNSRVFA